MRTALWQTKNRENLTFYCELKLLTLPRKMSAFIGFERGDVTPFCRGFELFNLVFGL